MTPASWTFSEGVWCEFIGVSLSLIFLLLIFLFFKVLFKNVFYLFLERVKRREERNFESISCLSHAPNWGPGLHANQARALTGFPTGDLSVGRPALNPLSHTSQHSAFHFILFIYLFIYFWFSFLIFIYFYSVKIVCIFSPSLHPYHMISPLTAFHSKYRTFPHVCWWESGAGRVLWKQ